MKIIRSVLVQDESESAGDVDTYNLPTNALSHIIFTLKCLNVTDEATLAEVLARLSKIEVLFKGESIVSISGSDLYALNCVMFGFEPILTNIVATDNATRAITLIIPLGRQIYDPKECFQPTKKGELQLQVTLSSTETAVDGVIYQIETVEMLDVEPTQFLKVTTLSKTPTSGIDNDIDLPIGNKLAGILLYSTTVPTGTAWTTTVDKVRLLLNNVEYNIANLNWESLHGELLYRGGYIGDHGAAYGDDKIVKYGLIDFSPRNIDDLLVDTAGASSVKLRVSAGDANVLRALPMEICAKR